MSSYISRFSLPSELDPVLPPAAQKPGTKTLHQLCVEIAMNVYCRLDELVLYPQHMYLQYRSLEQITRFWALHHFFGFASVKKPLAERIDSLVLHHPLYEKISNRVILPIMMDTSLYNPVMLTNMVRSVLQDLNIPIKYFS